MKVVISKIKMVESYMETLRCQAKGTSCIYPLRYATSYNGFHNAKTRLKKENMEFVFENYSYRSKIYLKVNRLK